MDTLFLQTFSDFQREKEQDISAVILTILNNTSEPMGWFFRTYKGFFVINKKKDKQPN